MRATGVLSLPVGLGGPGAALAQYEALKGAGQEASTGKTGLSLSGGSLEPHLHLPSGHTSLVRPDEVLCAWKLLKGFRPKKNVHTQDSLQPPCRVFSGSHCHAVSLYLPAWPPLTFLPDFPAELEALNTFASGLCILCSFTTNAVPHHLHTTSALS